MLKKHTPSLNKGLSALGDVYEEMKKENAAKLVEAKKVTAGLKNLKSGDMKKVEKLAKEFEIKVMKDGNNIAIVFDDKVQKDVFMKAVKSDLHIKIESEEPKDLTVEEALNEVRLKDPTKGKGVSSLFKKGASEKEMESAFNDWQSWKKQFSHIANLLTNASGYWYVTSGKMDLAKAIEKKGPDELKKFRSEVLKLVKLSREADKIMKKVKAQATDLIKGLEK